MSFFTIEKLKELGLTDEQSQKIFAERGKELAKYNDYEEIKRKYKEQGVELAKLKELEPEKLKEQIDLMSKNHKEQLNELELNHKQTVKKMAIKMNLTDVYDQDIVLSLLDLSKIDLDDEGNVKMGLNEQLESIRKDKEFLFKVNENLKTKATKPVEGTTINNNSAEVDNFVNAALKGAGLKGGE